ncbi:MAG: tetratricopeptide repeat protein [Saprospiraceae bacterium]
MAKKRRSFGDKIAESKRSIFVGRAEQVAQFQKNVNAGPDDDDFFNIFSVFGQGGVGKTTLIDQYQKIAQAKAYLTVLVDTEDARLYSIPAAMHAIAEAFEKKGAKFKGFSERYQDYLQKKGELEADPERPKESFGNLAKGGMKTVLKAGAKLVPGGELIGELLPTEAIANFTGEWVNFALKKFGNEDDVALLQYPVKVLTPLWVSDLVKIMERKNVAFFFDTYEVANPRLDVWLREILHQNFGEIPVNFLLVISGRRAIDREAWSKFENYTSRISLKPFTSKEARNYLAQRGITEERAIEEILSISGALPIYLSLLAEGDSASPDEIADPNEKVVARFLKHIKDPIQKKLALSAALPRKINKDIITCLLPEASNVNADALFEWLRNRPFVQKRGGHWAYHPVVRDLMLQHQKELSEQDWENTHLVLANWYKARAKRLETTANREEYFSDEEWCLLQIEQHFHLLCHNYKQHLPAFINDFVTTIRIKKLNAANPLVFTLLEAEKKEKNATWGKVLQKGVSAILAKMEEGALAMCQLINREKWLTNVKDASFFYVVQGIYEETFEETIACYENAITLNNKNESAYFNLGNSWHKEGNYAKAIEAYRKVILLNPKDAAAYNNLGLALYEQGSFDEAIKNYNCAIDLNPKDAAAYNNLGVILHERGNYTAAVENYQRVITFKSEDSTIHNNLGLAFENMKNYQAATEHYNRAIDLNGNYADAYYNLGNTLYKKSNYAAAINNYQRAIDLNPKYTAAYNNLGLAFVNLGKLIEAVESCQKWLEIEPVNGAAWNILGWYLLLMDDSDIAAAGVPISKAWELSNEQDYLASMNLGHVELLQGNKEKAFAWYQKSILLWEDKASFFEGMRKDYEDLKMAARGIDQVNYNTILQKLKEGSDNITKSETNAKN